MSKVSPLILITGVVIFELVGDIFLKKWAIHDWGLVGFGIGAITYICATLLWATSLQTETLAKAGIIYGVISLIVGVAAGIFLFHERLTPVNWLGFILAVISIVLIEL